MNPRLRGIATFIAGLILMIGSLQFTSSPIPSLAGFIGLWLMVSGLVHSNPT